MFGYQLLGGLLLLYGKVIRRGFGLCTVPLTCLNLLCLRLVGCTVLHDGYLPLLLTQRTMISAWNTALAFFVGPTTTRGTLMTGATSMATSRQVTSVANQRCPFFVCVYAEESWKMRVDAIFLVCLYRKVLGDATCLPKKVPKLLDKHQEGSKTVRQTLQPTISLDVFACLEYWFISTVGGMRVPFGDLRITRDAFPKSPKNVCCI